MPDQPQLTLHEISYSHPCHAVRAALDRHGLEYETVGLQSGPHADEVERVYGEGRRTVPGLLVDGEPVHGTATIFARIDQLAPDAGLYPDPHADRIREVEAGLAEELQSAARTLIWGALHFRPEALGTFGGAGQLDPAGTDFAIKMMRGAWRYLEITAVGVAEQLERLPSQFDAADRLIEEGLIGGEVPTAADFQIGSSVHMLLKVGDLRPLVEAHPAARRATEWFELTGGDVPAGAFPPGWVPTSATA
ncbi:MAG TPA: glutaredoxin [Solirubrobacterales bacterium]|nr:glutaredoxin [Solirubrobacterales bacterium]